jgi:hypothetical protein
MTNLRPMCKCMDCSIIHQKKLLNPFLSMIQDKFYNRIFTDQVRDEIQFETDKFIDELSLALGRRLNRIKDFVVFFDRVETHTLFRFDS